MESHPQNPEFRNNPENFHPCSCTILFGVMDSSATQENSVDPDQLAPEKDR